VRLLVSRMIFFQLGEAISHMSRIIFCLGYDSKDAHFLNVGFDATRMNRMNTSPIGARATPDLMTRPVTPKAMAGTLKVGSSALHIGELASA
jgi:hypothetical protein